MKDMFIIVHYSIIVLYIIQKKKYHPNISSYFKLYTLLLLFIFSNRYNLFLLDADDQLYTRQYPSRPAAKCDKAKHSGRSPYRSPTHKGVTESVFPAEPTLRRGPWAPGSRGRTGGERRLKQLTGPGGHGCRQMESRGLLDLLRL